MNSPFCVVICKPLKPLVLFPWKPLALQEPCPNTLEGEGLTGKGYASSGPGDTLAVFPLVGGERERVSSSVQDGSTAFYNLISEQHATVSALVCWRCRPATLVPCGRGCRGVSTPEFEACWGQLEAGWQVADYYFFLINILDLT